MAEVELLRAEPGLRVEHFRPRRDGEITVGTVVSCEGTWCRVAWEKAGGRKETAWVMTSSLRLPSADIAQGGAQ